MSRGVLEKKELERLCRWYEDCLEHIPEARTKALRAAAEAVKSELDRQISSRVDDSRGKVRRWQQVVMGSKGGYSKVAPVAVGVTNPYGKSYGYNSAQVTGYLERGHAVRQPSGKDPNYRPRLARGTVLARTGAVVPGRMFYSWTKSKASKIGIDAAEQVLEDLCEEFADLLAEIS